jgi:hypothetical protein
LEALTSECSRKPTERIYVWSQVIIKSAESAFPCHLYVRGPMTDRPMFVCVINWGQAEMGIPNASFDEIMEEEFKRNDRDDCDSSLNTYGTL